MKKKQKILIIVSIVFSVVILALATSYALFSFNVTKNSNFKVAIGSLELSIIDTETEDKFIMDDLVPIKDEVALTQDGYTFTIKNTGTIDSYYTIYLDDIILSDSGERLDNKYIRVNLLNNATNSSTTKGIDEYTDRVLASGYLDEGENVSYTLRMWLDYEAGNDAQNKYFATQIRVVGEQQNTIQYKEELLNGADPILTDNLVAVKISDNGKVLKADTTTEWYNYEKKKWANAVVLKNSSINYASNQEIKESNIESYFVWIPKFSYQVWDLGYYSNITYFNINYQNEIKIKFGLTNTIDRYPDECSTIGGSGASGSVSVGCYMTHPAFTSFNSNGFWVGKFETGYSGATSATLAATDVDKVDTSKIIIKPNVYSWRGISVGNIFKNSYDYLRSHDSHMMKNTEWGAVAYLSHSIYGTCTGNKCSEVRINNNSNYITGYAATEEPTKGYNSGTSIDGNRVEETSLGVDGEYTVNYLNTNSVVASTTGNYTGIYDMSGGAYEYLAAYTTSATTEGGSSGITSLYDSFFNNYKKYYDKYSSTQDTHYNNRIIGDATGELGPFNGEVDPDSKTRYRSSWYNDLANFVSSDFPWFSRGGNWTNGNSSGIFSFSNTSGGNDQTSSFRIVLTPAK